MTRFGQYSRAFAGSGRHCRAAPAWDVSVERRRGQDLCASPGRFPVEAQFDWVPALKAPREDLNKLVTRVRYEARL